VFLPADITPEIDDVNLIYKKPHIYICILCYIGSNYETGMGLGHRFDNHILMQNPS